MLLEGAAVPGQPLDAAFGAWLCIQALDFLWVELQSRGWRCCCSAQLKRGKIFSIIPFLSWQELSLERAGDLLSSEI